jgi:NAD(P)-dependent dehydrogenase (short-subunit alcohol dehydrogenase family)
VLAWSGASRGIGKATALALAAEGAGLLLVGRHEETLEASARECRDAAAGARAEVLVLDVTAADAGERVLEACQMRFSRIDALVNNAGTSSFTPLPELAEQEWEAQWQLHVMAPMRLMRAIAPVLAHRGWGRIVNVRRARPARRS